MGSLYLVRHGQTTHNADGIIQGPRVDSELSDVGRGQATALADALGQSGLDAVYSSPLRRARATASTITDCRAASMETRIVPELYEMDYGSFCGRRLDDVRDEVAQILDAWSMGFVHEAFPEGESPVLTQHRVCRFADRLTDAAEDADVAVVAHGRVNRILAATLLGTSLAELDRYPQDNANITQLAWQQGKWVVQRINDTDHLVDGTESAFS